MTSGRGSRWLGWVALIIGVACGTLRAADGDVVLSLFVGNTGARVSSSPAIGPDGTIYFGVSYGLTKKGYLLAINPVTRAMDADWPATGFPTKDGIESSPALSADGKTIYFTCADGLLYAVRTSDGLELWSKRIGIFSASSPAVGADGTIYVGSEGVAGDATSGDNGVHAFTPGGFNLWNFKTAQKVDSSPSIGADGAIYFGCWDGNVYALNALDGSVKWSRQTVSAVAASPAIAADGTVYVGSFDGYLYSLNGETGAINWQQPTSDRIQASAAIGPDGAIYVGSWDGKFYAFRPDGTRKWQPFGGGPAIVSSAAVRSDGVVIFGADDGTVRALDTETARVVWAKKVAVVDSRTYEIESSPVIATNGTVYVGGMDGRLHGFAGSGAPLSAYGRWPMFRRDMQHGGRAPATADGGRLLNLATRAQAGDGRNVIAGLVTAGTATKSYLLRGIGPTLSAFGVATPLRDPSLMINRLGSDEVLLANDNWGTGDNPARIASVSAAVGAFALAADSKDAVVLGDLQPGLYTASVRAGDGDTGIALVEAYDGDQNSRAARLVNLSTRAQVGTGDNILIPGFVIGGTDPVRLLVRAVGPGLVPFGVTGVLARPSMSVFSGPNEIRKNTGWTSGLDKGDLAGMATVVGAFALAEGSADCATLLTLGAGNYTIQVSGVNGTTGEALVEVYVLP